MNRGNTLQLIICLAALALSLTACGGGDNGPSGGSTVTVTGSVFAAPVSGATVTVRSSAGTTIAGPVHTLADGTFSVSVPASALSGAIVIESSGGTFADEASGLTTTAGTLATYVSAGSISAGGSVHLDPSTTIVHDLVTVHGMDLPGARAAFAAAFGFTPDHTLFPRNAPYSRPARSPRTRRALIWFSSA